MIRKRVDFRFVFSCDESGFRFLTDIIQNIKRDDLAPNLRNLLILLPYHIAREMGKNEEIGKIEDNLAQIFSNLSLEEKKLFRAYIELQKRSLPRIEEVLNDMLVKESIYEKMDSLKVKDKSVTISKPAMEDSSALKASNPVLNITDSIVQSVASSQQPEHKVETKNSIEVPVEKTQSSVLDKENSITEKSGSLDDEDSSGESVPDFFG